MPISLRLHEYKENLINKLAKVTGRTKTAVILEAVSWKLGTSKNKKQLIRTSCKMAFFDYMPAVKFFACLDFE
jgi:hypothetical protein